MSNNLFFSYLSEIQQILPDHVDHFIDALNTHFSSHPNPEKSSSQFVRVWKNSLSQKLFLESLIENPEHFALLSQLILKSDYFVDNLVRDPHLFSWLLNTNILSEPFSVEKMKKAANRAAMGSDQKKTRIKLLKQFQRKYLVAIGARDVLEMDSVYETTHYISELADQCLFYVFQILNEDYFKDSKIPGFAIFALGKYGGRELNYSSDIDLLAICENSDTIIWRNSEMSVQDILVKWLQDFISILSDNDSDGNFYRVDFRLRPEGEFGPLIPTSTGAINYYFSRGRTWERQMLLKIRFICGDEKIAAGFLKPIQSFIFNQLKPISGSEHLHRSLHSIHDNQNRNDRNIKTSLGGIRWIEFMCQTLQLELGTHDQKFWNGNTLEVLGLLHSKKIIEEKHFQILAEAYSFFRKLEHHLQFYLNQQTHEIPKNQEELSHFAVRFSEGSPEILFKKIESFKNEVQKIVYIYFPVEQSDLIKTQSNPTVKLFLKYTELSEEQVRYVESISTVPDSELIKNTERILSAFPDPSSLVKLWLSDLKYLKDVLMLIEKAPVLVPKIISVPQLWETLLSKSEFYISGFENPHLYQVHAETSQTIWFLKNSIDFQQYTNSISLIYDDVLNYYFSQIRHDRFLLIAMGKLGSKETVIGSDADLTAIQLNPNDFDLEKEIVSINPLFTYYTNYGLHFQVDYRLRPEGKSAPVLQIPDTYKTYFETRADYWEFLTYSRARLLSGDKWIFHDLFRSIDNSFRKRKTDLLEQYSRLRMNRLQQSKTDSNSFNVKKDAGGLLDIEIFIQHNCLKYGMQISETCGKNMFDLSVQLFDRTGMSIFNEIRFIYLKLRLFETRQKLADTYKSGIFNARNLAKYDDLKITILQSKEMIDKLS